MATTNMAENISVDLDQLLTRLSDTLLSPTADDSHIRATPYERTRVSANVEYARTLLLRLEHTTQDIKTQTQKTSVQNDLADKRNLIKRLNTRLLELNQLAALHDDDEDSSEDEDDEEANRPREFAPAVQTSDTIDTDPSLTSPQQAAQDLASTLRNRASATNPSAPPDTATTTALFGNRTAANPTAASGSEKLSTEQVLESANRDQDLLTTSLVTLAKSLKQSSMQFASSLENEKEVLRRAESGLDKNSMGMEAAGNRMSALRRMTEGKGWWGRIKLYAIIAGLWIAAFLLVFVGPKLRF